MIEFNQDITQEGMENNASITNVMYISCNKSELQIKGVYFSIFLQKTTFLVRTAFVT